MTNSRRALGYWANFPVTYRVEQVATMMQWIAVGESGMVIGGSGTGKSNLAGFLSSRPDAIKPYVTGGPDCYCFLSFDINSLPALTVPFFYRGLFQVLQDASTGFAPDVQQAMQQLTQGRVDWTDVFEVLVILQKAHGIIIRQAEKKVVWLLDRFDEACRHLDAQTLNSLRSLRDQFKSELCYMVFTRHPLTRLRDPDEISEFYDIVAANTCWVGPMVDRDARWITRQMAERLGTTFGEPEVVQLIEVSGGLPAFMKAACLALAEGALTPGQSRQTWTKQLLARPEFQRNCQEIWDGLSSEEQATLLALTAGTRETMLKPRVVAYLEQAGLLVRSTPEAKPDLFSPIFKTFVVQQREQAAKPIELHPKTRVVLRGGIPLDVELTSNEDRLLSYFLEHPGEICRKDTLIRTVWPDEQMVKGIRDDRLAQLVKRLREKIEPEPAHPVYIQTVRGRGYRFVQPGE